MVNFAVKHGRGILCAPMAPEVADRLGLKLMVARQHRQVRHAVHRVGGRARAAPPPAPRRSTARARCARSRDPRTQPSDLVRPGPRVPAARGAGRRAAPRRPHRGGARPVPARGAAPGGRACARSSPTTAAWRGCPSCERFARAARARHPHHPRPDRVPPPAREAGASAWCRCRCRPPEGEFQLHLYESALEGDHHVALVKGDVDGERAGAGARALAVPDRRRVRLAALRLRPADARRAARDRRSAAAACSSTCARRGAASGSRTSCAPTRSRTAGYDTVEANVKLGLPGRPARLRHRRADPGRPRACARSSCSPTTRARWSGLEALRAHDRQARADRRCRRRATTAATSRPSATSSATCSTSSSGRRDGARAATRARRAAAAASVWSPRASTRRYVRRLVDAALECCAGRGARRATTLE